MITYWNNQNDNSQIEVSNKSLYLAEMIKKRINSTGAVSDEFIREKINNRNREKVYNSVVSRLNSAGIYLENGDWS